MARTAGPRTVIPEFRRSNPHIAAAAPLPSAKHLKIRVFIL